MIVKRKKQVLITGANSDIGLEVCRQYLVSGYEVLAFHRSSDFNLETFGKSFKGCLTPVRADFSDTEQFEDILQQNYEQIKKSDVLVHLAAMKRQIPFYDFTSCDLMNHFKTNVGSYVTLLKLVTPGMFQKGWGRIVNISSIGVKFGGGKDTFAYSLTKHASEFLPAEHKKWAARNVFINSIRVGVTDTQYFKKMDDELRKSRVRMIPAQRMATPEEMAHYIFWIGSEQNTFMTGQILSPTGGE